VFRAHVEEEFEAAHANGPEGHKCRTMHGHTWLAEVEFEYPESMLDENGWGPDFGAIKAIIKPLDHNELNSHFAGRFPPSAENLAKWLWNEAASVVGLTRGRAQNLVVRIHEGGGNFVEYRDEMR